MKNQRTQYFYFDGVDSRDYGIYLSSAIKISGAQPNVEKISIPGRSGDLLRYDGSFSNVSFTAECFVHGSKVADAIAAIAQWTMGTQGYRKLEFPWEDGYRMAYVTSGPDMECLSKGVRAFTLDFSCAPQVWTYAGQQAIQIANGDTLQNSWMEAKPLITIYGPGGNSTATGELTIGDTGITVTVRDFITLDCETQDAYRGLANANSRISASQFPVLSHGANPISWTMSSGDFTKVEIVPRWWHL